MVEKQRNVVMYLYIKSTISRRQLLEIEKNKVVFFFPFGLKVNLMKTILSGTCDAYDPSTPKI